MTIFENNILKKLNLLFKGFWGFGVLGFWVSVGVSGCMFDVCGIVRSLVLF